MQILFEKTCYMTRAREVQRNEKRISIIECFEVIIMWRSTEMAKLFPLQNHAKTHRHFRFFFF